MRFDQFYASPGVPPVQQAATGPSPAQSSAPQSPRTVPRFGAQAWLGVLVALVLLRLVYEFSE
jgi:hypothetical protein